MGIFNDLRSSLLKFCPSKILYNKVPIILTSLQLSLRDYIFKASILKADFMIKGIRFRVESIPADIFLFLGACCFWGFSTSVGDAIFNNFLNESFQMSDFKRSFLEVPRELPGLSVVFISALFFFLCSRRLAALAMFFCAIGSLLLAITPPVYSIMVIWLFLLSTGQHIMLPLNSSIGMELARSGHTGKRLGQFNSARNFAAVSGSALVFLGFRYLHFSFTLTFIIASIGFLIASLLLLKMKKQSSQSASSKLKIYKEYNLYYFLSILYGARKQIFLTFAPWVLVTIFKRPTTTVATLMTIGGTIGIFFQPFIGWCIDRFGEKLVLASEAVILVIICIGYGTAQTFFSNNIAFFVTAVCFITDGLLMSVGMARATWLKKIALHPSHVTPTLQMAVSLDHIFSISGAIFCGIIWKIWGYQYVFLFAAFIAIINFFSALRIKTAIKEETAETKVVTTATI
jgi:predicted MFS family arabinose efflux permease